MKRIRSSKIDVIITCDDCGSEMAITSELHFNESSYIVVIQCEECKKVELEWRYH